MTHSLPARPERLLRINEVAAETGLTTRAIRYYEEIGLLEPAARSDGDYRLYDASDLERLRFIRSSATMPASPGPDRPAARGRAARERNRERSQTADPAERRALITRRPRPGRPPDRDPRGEGRPPGAMIEEARDAPPHLDAHLAELDGGPPPHPERAARIARRPERPRRAIRASVGRWPFRHRNYRLFFGGQAVSLVGTWMQQVAQAWLVLQLTHDPIWLGIVAAAQFIPVIIFGLFAGVAADALPKRRVLIGPSPR